MLSMIKAWRLERVAIRELSRLADRDLADLGIGREDIRAAARNAAASTRDTVGSAVAQPGLGVEPGSRCPAEPAEALYRPTSLAA